MTLPEISRTSLRMMRRERNVQDGAGSASWCGIFQSLIAAYSALIAPLVWIYAGIVWNYCIIFRDFDIWGVVGKNLDTPAMMENIRAYGNCLCLKQPGHFVIEHDDRWSLVAFAQVAARGWAFLITLKNSGGAFV